MRLSAAGKERLEEGWLRRRALWLQANDIFSQSCCAATKSEMAFKSAGRFPGIDVVARDKFVEQAHRQMKEVERLRKESFNLYTRAEQVWIQAITDACGSQIPKTGPVLHWRWFGTKIGVCKIEGVNTVFGADDCTFSHEFPCPDNIVNLEPRRA